MLHCPWDVVCDRCNCYFSFWAIFCPFTSGDIITLHMCTKNYDQMMYSSWDMVHDRCNCYFSFWAVFCPYTLLTAQKIKILKNEKTPWRYHHFTYVYQKLWSDDIWFLRYAAWQTDGQKKRKFCFNLHTCSNQEGCDRATKFMCSCNWSSCDRSNKKYLHLREQSVLEISFFSNFDVRSFLLWDNILGGVHFQCNCRLLAWNFTKFRHHHGSFKLWF